MQQMSSPDPVMEALGLATPAMADQEWMAYQQAAAYDPTYCDYSDPTQLAWMQAQAMIQTAWQLQQMASLSAQAAAAFGSSACTLPGATTIGTPRTATAPASETTPMSKTGQLASEMSTEPGSPSGDVESEEEQSDNGGHSPKDFAIPPPPPTPTKLDLHAIIFEKAKDPISADLLSLIKKNEESSHGKEKGKAILALLNDGENTAPPKRTGPIASGAHRRAAVAARQAAEKAAASEKAAEEESAPRRRRPRGGRGGRSGRSS